VLALAVSCVAPLGGRLASPGRAGTGASSGTTIDGTRDVSPTAEPAADAVVDVEGARARPGRSVLGTPLLATLRAGDAARANGSAAAGITGGANDRGDGARTAASAGGVRPGRRAGDALLLLREASASEEGTRPGARDAAGLGATDTRQQGEFPESIATTWLGIRIAKARYLEWGVAVGDGAEEANEGGDKVHLLSGVVRLPFVRAGEGDSKDFGLTRDASAFEGVAHTGLRRTLDASTARSSVSGHVLPTEKVPLVFSLDL
jgi:hypothetical protein